MGPFVDTDDAVGLVLGASVVGAGVGASVVGTAVGTGVTGDPVGDEVFLAPLDALAAMGGSVLAVF